jgi:hypothetical protein
MRNWVDDRYTYYGVQTLSHTARSQGEDTYTCWAFSLGAILGLPWSTVALHTKLDSAISGVEDVVEFRKLVSSLNAAANSNWPQLRELARWYSADWDGQMLERSFPQALAIRGHVVVALAIGKSNGNPDMIRYWEPGNGQIITIPVAEFVKRFAPEFGITTVRS